MTDALSNVLIVAYLLIVLAMIGVILLQRSEGGGLGIGGGNSGGLMSVRGSANLLTRTTAILAGLFFATAIGLTVLSQLNTGTQDILNKASQSAPGAQNVFDALNGNGKGNGSSGSNTSGESLPVPGNGGSTSTPAPSSSTQTNGGTSTQDTTSTAPASSGSGNSTAPATDSNSNLPVPQGTDTTGTQGGQTGGN